MSVSDSILYQLGNKQEKGSGKIIYETCPFCEGGDHQDKWSFVVFVKEPFKDSYYSCQRGKCGAKGNIRQLVEHVTGDKPTYEHKKEVVISKPKVKPKVELLPLNEVQKSYMTKRGLKQETWEHFRIASKAFGNEQLLAFPFYKDSELTFLKYRKAGKIPKGEPKMRAEAGTQPILFNMEKHHDSIIICEGEFDSMIVWQVLHEKHDVVSIPIGSQGFTWLEECYDYLMSYKKFYLWGDADEPGQKFNEELAKKLGKEFCYRVGHLPDPAFPSKTLKDPNLIHFYHGNGGIADCLGKAEQMGEGMWIPVSSIPYVSLINEESIRSRIKVINSCFGGYVFGEWYLITGYRGHGKSSFAFGEVLYMLSCGIKVAVFSGEQRRQQFRRWLQAMAFGDKAKFVHSPRRNKDVSVATPEQIEVFNKWLDNNLIFYNTESYSKKSEDISDAVEYAYKRLNIKVFLIDNLMTVEFGGYESESKDAVRFLENIKAVTEKYELISLIIAHPRKKQQDDGNDLIIPTLDSIKGLGDIGNLAQNVFVVQKLNDKMRKGFINRFRNMEAKINKAKSVIRSLKERETGADGITDFLGFNTGTRRFYDIDENGDEIKNMLNSYKFPWEEVDE